MFDFLWRLFCGGGVVSANPLLVGTWVPAQGNPKEAAEYRDDGTVRMAMFGGMLHMTGRYRFIGKDTVRIEWDGQPSRDADEALEALNRGMAGHGVQARAVRETVLRITVTETELTTLHVEKGRTGRFVRVRPAPTRPAASGLALVARCVLLGQRTVPDVVTPASADSLARSAAESALEVSGTALDFSDGSLIMVDQILNGFRKEGHDEDTIPQTLLMFGCYVGEVYVRSLGGAWAYRDESALAGSAGPALVVTLPDGTACDPIGAVLRAVKQGDESVFFSYAMACAAR